MSIVAKNPSRIGEFTVGSARAGMYDPRPWENQLIALSQAVTWKVANINVTRDSVTGKRDTDYSLTHSIRGVFEERGGDLVALPAGFVQRGDAVFTCFDGVRELDRILIPESGRLYQVGHTEAKYETLKDTDRSRSFCYRVCDLHFLAFIREGTTLTGTTEDFVIFFYPNILSDYNLCTQADEFVAACSLASVYNLCVTADESVVASVASAYSLATAPT
jgi:hypothetical protein